MVRQYVPGDIFLKQMIKLVPKLFFKQKKTKQTNKLHAHIEVFVWGKKTLILISKTFLNNIVCSFITNFIKYILK